MGSPARTRTFSAADLVLPPNLLTLARIPLAVAFPFAAAHQVSALAVLAAAGVSDMLDGWLARRSGQSTALGAVLDPIADKIFAVTVVGTLLVQGKIPPIAIPALLAREILEAPLLLLVLLQRRPKGESVPVVRANVPGKLATIAQFVAVLAALAIPEALPVALGVAAASATVAGIGYWVRELHRRRS